MKLSQKIRSKNHRLLLYGGPKSGKTKLVGELSSHFNLYWFDLENGIDTLRQLPEEQQNRIEVFSIPDTRSFPIAIQTCLKIIKGGEFNICEKHGVIACTECKKQEAGFSVFNTALLTPEDIVVFDSLTQLTNSAIAHITKNKPEDYRLEWEDWAILGKLMDIFLSHIQQAPFNVCCISHETEAEMEDGKNKLVPTAGTRNFSRNAAKYFDEVVYAEIKNGSHVFASSTTYKGTILTGSRSGAILERSQYPSLVPIFTGEVEAMNQMNEEKAVDSPGNKALGGLKKLSLSLKG